MEYGIKKKYYAPTGTVEYSTEIAGKQQVIYTESRTNKIKRWYSYDADGNQIRTIDSNGNETKREYDSEGRLYKVTSPAGFSFYVAYDKDGKEIGYKLNENGKVLTWG